MKKHIIQNFLNLPGIVGLALMDGHSRPYFCGIDQSLNFQQKEALTQGIQQVINTTPAGFEAFDFHFSHRDARIYKLDNGVILLVVTDAALDSPAYDDAITQLKETLQTDPHSTVSTFRLLVGSTTLTKQSYWTNGPAPLSTDASPESPKTDVSSLPRTPPQGTVPWEQCITALNTLTDATAQYLGKIVVANTWRSTRPDNDALARLQIDRSGHFSHAPGADGTRQSLVSPEEHALLRQWVQQFTQRCSKIIRDYPEMVLHDALTDQQRTLLDIQIP